MLAPCESKLVLPQGTCILPSAAAEFFRPDTTQWKTYMTERTGHCLCGAVSFKLATEPLVTRICWCRDCQHISANGTVNLLVGAEGLAISGQLAEYTKKADSGNEVTRQFCPNCGTHLFARVAARPQFCVVRAGNLDEPSSIKPSMNIWTSSAPQWACLNTTLEQFERQAPPPKPAASASQA
jgi:hypothetical protein